MARLTARCLKTFAFTLFASLCACGGGSRDNQPLLAILSAFPAELAPLLEGATVTETLVIEDRTFRLGTLAGVPVVLGLTGIGLINAAATANVLFDYFAPAGVVFSGVGGSPLRIGDVVVPEAWTFGDGETYRAHPPWAELAGEIAVSGTIALERCTLRPAASPSEPSVCLAHEPVVAVGGLGRSSDPFGDVPVRCVPGGGEVFGCDVGSATLAGGRPTTGRSLTAGARAFVVEDMETAAIAREALGRGIPFIAFRGVSDGAGDPLGLPGFPAQFFTYYRLAARNAASAAVAFVERLARDRRRDSGLPGAHWLGTGRSPSESRSDLRRRDPADHLDA